jgi:hypothetical protein
MRYSPFGDNGNWVSERSSYWALPELTIAFYMTPLKKQERTDRISITTRAKLSEERVTRKKKNFYALKQKF